MRLPLGLDLKSLVVGGLLAYFAIPFLLSLLARRKDA